MRYYFHLHECGSLIADNEGLDLPDGNAAFAAAVAGARSVIAAGAMDGKIPLGSVIRVEDEHGRRVLDLPFRDAVRLDG